MTRLNVRAAALFPIVLSLLAGCGPAGLTGGTAGDSAARTANLPYEPLPTHPRAELSNLRFDRGRLGKERYKVDWKWTQTVPENHNVVLVIKPSDRMEITSNVETINKQGGTLSAETMSNKAGEDGQAVLEKGCEMYLVVQSGSFRYKISNSLTTGGVSPTGTRPAPSP